MPINSIITEIDAEIERLQKARVLLSSIGESPKKSPVSARSAHHLGAYAHAAPGGLGADPVTRPRRAHLHLPNSKAAFNRSLLKPLFCAVMAHFGEGHHGPTEGGQANQITPCNVS